MQFVQHLAQFLELGLDALFLGLFCKLYQMAKGIHLLLKFCLRGGVGELFKELVFNLEALSLFQLFQLLFVVRQFALPLFGEADSELEILFKALEPSFEGLARGVDAGGKASLKHQQGERHIAVLALKRASILALHILGERVVKLLFGVAQRKGAREHMARREQRASRKIF